jgi:DinB family protein
MCGCSPSARFVVARPGDPSRVLRAEGRLDSMTVSDGTDPLLQFTGAIPARPLPLALRVARADVAAAIATLRTIPDARLAEAWAWKGGSEEEIRYGFYRIAEVFELAAISAEAELRRTGPWRGLAADRIAPATAARWDLQGVLLPLDASAWDADPGGGEWTVRQTMGHVIGGQRSYGVGTAWWQAQGLAADDPDLPSPPEAIYEVLPSDEAEAAGTPSEVRDRLDLVLDLAAERLAGLPEDRLALAARWSGFAVDVGHRLGRWSSHLREHTIQVEKTLVMLDHQPTEVDRLVRHVLAAWGRAEAVVYGAAGAEDAAGILADAAAGARVTADEVAGIAGD